MNKQLLCLLAFITMSFSAYGQGIVNWKEGLRLTYVETDRWKKEVGQWEDLVVKVEGDVMHISTTGTRVGDFTVDRSGTYTRPMPRGSADFSYQPVKLPLTEGDTWEWVFHGLSSTGAPTRYRRNCKAGRVEQIEVPAGKFAARKYECSGDYQVTGSVTGTLNRVAWFANDLNINVKVIDAWAFFAGRDETTTVLQRISSP